MARISVSGTNDEALVAPATDVREVISGLDIDGMARRLHLMWLAIANEHASQLAVVEIYDADESTAVTAGLQRAVIHVPAQDTVIIEYPEPGLIFVTNVTAATTNGTIATLGGISGGGYLA